MRKLLLAYLSALLVIATASSGRSDAADVFDNGGAAPWDNVAPPVFSHLSSADGLPYPVVLGLAQDRRGFLWSATPGGAARWDGYRMTVFRHSDQDPSSIPEDILTAAVADRSGQVWFSTASGVIVRYDESAQGFVAYRDQGKGFGRPFGMAFDHKGGLWVASRRGLFRLDIATGMWRPENTVPRGEIGSVLVDRAGRVWAGTVEGLMAQNGDGQPFSAVTMPNLLAGDMVSALYEDGKGILWFGTRSGYVGTIDDGDGTASLVPALTQSGHRVTAFAEPRPGVLWIGEYGGGIRELRHESGAVRQFTRDPANASSLGDDTVTALLVDASGLVWTSSLGGLHRYIPANKSIVTMVAQAPYGLPGRDVRSVAAAADGKVWLGFRVEGLALMDGRADVVKPSGAGRWPLDLPPGMVQAIADASDGQIWAGMPGGLFQIDVKSGLVMPYEALIGANIRALLHDETDLWVGGSMGLARIPLNGAPPQFFKNDPTRETSLSDNSVSAIYRDSRQRVWVATQRGFNLLENPQTGLFRRVFNAPLDRESLPSDVVSSIAEDKFGRLWLATANGIGVFDPEDGWRNQGGKAKFLRLGMADGLSSGTILSVIEGAGGRIVAGTGNGLAVIDPETFSVRAPGPADGLQIGTFWAGAATQLTDGTLALGGFGGMAVVRPDALPQWTFQPPVAATQVRVGGRVVNPLREIVVGPDDGGVQVDFAALDFSDPERSKYAYRLNERDWTSADSHHRTASYTNLAPGLHRLEIKGTNSVGVWGDPLVLGIRVLPAWHQTLWFRLLAILTIIAALAATYQGRKVYYQRRERDLNRQIDAKTEEARNAQEAAEAAARMKSRFLAIIGHEIRTPLNGVLGMLQLMQPHALERETRDQLAIAQQSGEMLRQLVESVLEYGREGVEPADIIATDFDYRRFVRQAVDVMRPQAVAKSLRLEIKPGGDGGGSERGGGGELDPVAYIRADQAKLSRILLNLLGNAIKFTDTGGVSVAVALKPARDGMRILSIEVADTGIGVAPDMRAAIFGEFVQADDSIARKFGGVGLGLAISYRLAAQIGGTLTLCDATAEDGTATSGSVFRLEAPVEIGSALAAAHPAAPRAVGGLRLLVVDDDETNLRVAERMLIRLGHRPTMVTSGKDAIAALAATAFDTVLMDLRMPEMDGIEATRRIRRQEQAGLADGQTARVRIIAMTADLTDEIWRQCEAAGMDDGLSKPVQLSILRDALVPPAAVAQPKTNAAPREQVALDVAFLKAQVEKLGAEEMVRQAKAFHRFSRQTIAAMADAADQGDRAMVEALAHRLCGTATPLGLAALSQLAARLAATTPNARPADLQAQITALRNAREKGFDALTIMARTLAQA